MPLALIVEDDENIRLLYREALERGGFTLLSAGGFKEAVKILHTETPDIAFVDMNMPEHPGTEVLAYIRSVPRLAGMKLVVVTANNRADERAAEYGVDLFLIKPVPIADMIQLARRLTGITKPLPSDPGAE